MEKLLFRSCLLLAILVPSVSMAQIYVACTEGGGCNTYDLGGGNKINNRTPRGEARP